MSTSTPTSSLPMPSVPIPSMIHHAAFGSKEQAGPFKTAFIHLHSLASRDISLPCPQGLIETVQQLLVDVVVFYDQFSIQKTKSFNAEEMDRLALYGQELQWRLQFITNRIGERLMEAMFWAWLHALLQGEQHWMMDLNRDRALQESCLLLDDASVCTTLHRRIRSRVKDASALRRVIVFTFEALRQISSSAPPVYAAEQEESPIEPPSYCACSVHCKQEQEISYCIDDEEFPLQPSHIEAPFDQNLDRPIFTEEQLQSFLYLAEREMQRWKPIGQSLRTQQSSPSTCCISSLDGFSPSNPTLPREKLPLHLDLQADFDLWLRQPPLNNLRIEHRLERRHWSLEQLLCPVLTIE